MVWRYGVIGLGLLAVVAGCQGAEMAHEQEAAAAATGADDGPPAGDAFGEIGGSVGDGAGDRGGELPDVGEFRDPRFGRAGSLR